MTANALISSGAVVANLVGGLSAGTCTVAPPGAGFPVTLPVSVATPVVEPYSVSCGIGGMGADTDLDGLIDEDRIDTVDNDGDTLIDEDSGYLLPTVCISNSIGFSPTWQPVIDGHVSDPNPANNGALTCQTVLQERLFSPSFSVVQDDGATPSDPGFNGPFPLTIGTPPLDDDCLLTQPCEQLVEYEINAPLGVPGTPGAQPLAGVVTVRPGNGSPTGAYYMQRGIADPYTLASIPNGTTTVRSGFALFVNLGSAVPSCAFGVSSAGFNLVDGALPLAAGEGPDSPTSSPADLINPLVWPLGIEFSPLFLAFNSGLLDLGPNAPAAPGSYSGAPIWSRATGLIPGLSSPANVITFNLGAGGWASVLITGDPAAPVTSPTFASQPCTPLQVSADYLGETVAGLDLITCNVIKGGSNPADFHYIAGVFQRTDTGQSVTIPDPNKCTADNDVAVSKSDDLTVDAPINLTHTETINMVVTNGQVPGNVAVSVPGRPSGL